MRLDDGHVLWRSEASLRPLLVGFGCALGLSLAPPRVVALVLEGAKAGLPAWTSESLPWPEWAATAQPGAVDLESEAAWLNSDVGLHWQLRSIYTGGAAPGPTRTTRQVATGACCIDPATGAVRVLARWPTRPSNAAQPEAVADTHVLAQRRIGSRRYQLVVHDVAGLQRTTLVARDATLGLMLWERVLDEVPRQPPAGLRP